MWQNFGLLLIINQQGGKKYPTGVTELFELISEKIEFVIHPNLLNNFTVKNYKAQLWAILAEE